MSQFFDAPARPFTAGVTIAQHLRVHLSSGKLAISGVTDQAIGNLLEEAFAVDEVRSVRLDNADGTVKMVCAGAVAAGAVVYQAAGGKIDDVKTGKPIGVALEAGSAANSVIEVLVLGFSSIKPDTTIADPSGGSTTDAEARTAIGLLIDRMQAAGIIL